MYKPISLFIALRYLWNTHLPQFKKIIIILAIISMSASIASLIILISIINGSEANFKKNILSFIPHLIITNKNQHIKKSEFPKNILKLNNIEHISDFISKEVIVQSKDNLTVAEIIGVDSTNSYNVNNYNIKNILHALHSGYYNIIIGAKLAKKLNVCIGDKIKLILLSHKNLLFMKENISQHIFNVINIFSTNNEVDYYQILMNKEDSLQFLNYSKNYITGWRVWLKNPLFLDILQIKKIVYKFILLDWKTEQNELFKAIQMEKYIMLFLFSLIILVSGLNIFIILNIYILEKKNDIAILKTHGFSCWKIMLIFIIFSVSVAIIGNILGIIISIVIIMQNNFLKFFLDIFFNGNKIKLILIPTQVFLISFTSILFSIFSTLYPALKIIQCKPARILYHE